jgi:endonuclease/exonuclease/phosphatase family metal-dependent hydrolase
MPGWKTILTIGTVLAAGCAGGCAGKGTRAGAGESADAQGMSDEQYEKVLAAAPRIEMPAEIGDAPSAATGPVVMAEPAAAAAAVPIGQSVRVGTWNIEWLGTPNNRKGAGHGVLQSADDLATLIQDANVDVLGLEEIHATKQGNALRNDVLDGVVATLRQRTGKTWRYRLFPNATADTSQVCGVMWNTSRVSASPSKPLVVNPPASQPNLLMRRPVGTRFRTGTGRTDFVMVVVHLKCCNEAARREQEAQLILDALPQLRADTNDDADVLIMGDSNINRHTEPAVAKFASQGFEDLNASEQSTYISGGALDRAFVPPGAASGSRQAEFDSSAFNVFKSGVAAAPDYRKRFSDHYLVWTEIKVMADDD